MSSHIVSGGSVFFCNRDKAFRVIFGQSYVGNSARYFTIKRYGSKKAAEEAAETFRREESTRLGWNSEVITAMRDNGHDVPLNMKQFFGSYHDGDGSVGLYKNKGSWCPVVSFKQSQDVGIPAILQFIKDKYYHGNITSQKPKNPKHRRKHTLSILSTDAVIRILTDLTPTGLLKYPQIGLLLRYLNGEITDAQWVADELMRMKEIPVLQTVPIYTSGITDYSVAGLIEAEGCISITNGGDGYYLGIAQTSSPPLLYAIHAYLNMGGKVTEKESGDWELVYTGENARTVIKRLLPLLIGKKRQGELLLEFHRKRFQLTDEQKAWYVQEVKRLKKL